MPVIALWHSMINIGVFPAVSGIFCSPEATILPSRNKVWDKKDRPYVPLYRRIVGHVHDEVIIETDQETTVEEICGEMQKSPPWLPGIELRADGYECGYYMKL